jgi:hypothetical protein
LISIAKLVFSTTAIHMQRSSLLEPEQDLCRGARSSKPALYRLVAENRIVAAPEASLFRAKDAKDVSIRASTIPAIWLSLITSDRPLFSLGNSALETHQARASSMVGIATY